MNRADFGYGTMIADFPQKEEVSVREFEHSDFKGIGEVLSDKRVVIGVLLLVMIAGYFLTRKGSAVSLGDTV